MSKEVSDGDRRKGAAKPYFGRLFPRRSHSTLPHSESPKVTERYSETEDASARFWAIYISEAERYDSALIESWKADMSGMLIFSGLFSASLTAFLIESYKNLIPNSGDMTVTLLSQVSQQLNAMSSGTSLPIPSSPPPFKIDTSSLVCNAFWFLSLGLSLTCALLATLVEQWAREFMHKTEMRPSPVRRARVFSFLYYGVSRFRMHAIVDIIPMLLHLALVLFLSGLVAFLLPINRIMTALVASILAAFLAFYCVLTVIPVIALDCPYRTPLSGIFWRIVQRFCYLIQRPFTDRSLTEAVLAAAMQKRSTRDERAVLWTLESLTDDRELLPFVEAIPDMIYGPSGLRRVDDHLFRLVLQTADAHTSISGRIFALLRSSENLHPEDPWRSRRQIAALAALWALGILVPRITIAPMEAVFWIDHTNLSSLHIPAEYRTSLIALAKYIRLKNIQNRFQELHNLFAVHDLSKIRDRRRVAHVLSGSVDRLRRDVDAYRVKIPSTTYVLGVLAHAAALDPADTAHETWEISRRALSELNNEEMWLPHFSQIAFELLRDSFYAGSAAYRLLVTCREILPWVAIIGPAHLNQYKLFKTEDDLHEFMERCSTEDLDVIMRCTLRLLPVISPETVLPVIYWYLANRETYSAFDHIFEDCDLSVLAASILHDMRQRTVVTDVALRGLTILCLWSHQIVRLLDCTSLLSSLELKTSPDSLDALPTLISLLSSSTLSSLASQIRRCKRSLFVTADLSAIRQEVDQVVSHPLLRETTGASSSAASLPALAEMCTQITSHLSAAYLSCFTRLLLKCTARTLPYRAASTLNHIRTGWAYARLEVATEIQREFAKAVLKVVQCYRYTDHPFTTEAQHITDQIWGFLDEVAGDTIMDPEAAQLISDALSLYGESKSDDFVEDLLLRHSGRNNSLGITSLRSPSPEVESPVMC